MGIRTKLICQIIPIIIFNLHFILFDFNLNPFDIAKAIYYLFFIFFFIYTRFYYNIIQHYKQLIKIIK